MTPEIENELRGKLREQVGFIETSCDAFDKGRQSEALRVALSLRVLFHQTASSTALVRQLGLVDLKLLSTKGGPPPEFVAMMKRLKAKVLFEGSLIIAQVGASTGLIAPLGNLPPIAFQVIPLEEWLDETVFISGPHRVTRHELFKWAANKDGGGHVDIADMPAAYKAYRASGAFGTANVGGKDFPFEDAHLVALRQMGYEVMNSPEIAALAR